MFKCAFSDRKCSRRTCVSLLTASAHVSRSILCVSSDRKLLLLLLFLFFFLFLWLLRSLALLRCLLLLMVLLDHMNTMLGGKIDG